MRVSEIPTTVKNMIFDLGGVILNLSYQRTYAAFSALSGLSIGEIEDRAKHQEDFLLYEKGLLSDQEFRNFLRTTLGINEPDHLLDQAWNAMLLDIPVQRLNVLLNLKSRFNTALLSNTNNIHLQAFRNIVESTGHHTIFEDHFHNVYYSHEVGMRKPELSIFEHVLNETKFDRTQTIFFDDLLPNLIGGEKAGLYTYHVTDANELFKKLDQYK